MDLSFQFSKQAKFIPFWAFIFALALLVVFSLSFHKVSSITPPRQPSFAIQSNILSLLP
jgi:hypothetical protein